VVDPQGQHTAEVCATCITFAAVYSDSSI